MAPSFIESGCTTRVEYDKWIASGATSASGGGVKIRGMSVSGNVIPAVMLAQVTGCGDMEMMNIMEGQHMTEEMLKLNPWHQMPNMKDGDVEIAESGAIIRYIANKYAPQAYGDGDAAKMAIIDWALEWANTNFSKNFSTLWYPATGFGAAPPDQAEANKKSTENLNLFAGKFLCGPGKFIGGYDTPSIADYVCATRFHMVSHPTVKAVCGGFEPPARIKVYVLDFLSQCKAKSFLEQHDGFLASKMPK